MWATESSTGGLCCGPQRKGRHGRRTHPVRQRPINLYNRIRVMIDSRRARVVGVKIHYVYTQFNGDRTLIDQVSIVAWSCRAVLSASRGAAKPDSLLSSGRMAPLCVVQVHDDDPRWHGGAVSRPSAGGGEVDRVQRVQHGGHDQSTAGSHRHGLERQLGHLNQPGLQACGQDSDA